MNLLMLSFGLQCHPDPYTDPHVRQILFLNLQVYIFDPRIFNHKPRLGLLRVVVVHVHRVEYTRATCYEPRVYSRHIVVDRFKLRAFGRLYVDYLILPARSDASEALEQVPLALIHLSVIVRNLAEYRSPVAKHHILVWTLTKCKTLHPQIEKEMGIEAKVLVDFSIGTYYLHGAQHKISLSQNCISPNHVQFIIQAQPLEKLSPHGAVCSAAFESIVRNSESGLRTSLSPRKRRLHPIQYIGE
ncbi:hypothetical protein GGR53DRAFT_472178 [Hypoxylon sp. FL1150]|nr:hypothetical protein GGR53DRAFT_472178 [Hypoxylon sp. FL1150]